MPSLKDTLEQKQISIYIIAVLLAVLMVMLIPGTAALEIAINPALALMLFVTFLQVPIAELRRAFRNGRFLAALLLSNFLVVPILVASLLPFLPSDPMVRLGVLLVLLTPCIDYVVTFAHLGRADARLLLASTPALLVVQMLFLPIYLKLFLGDEATDLVHVGPYIHAFAWLIAVPLLLAGLVQLWAARHQSGAKLAMTLSYLPVPATALVLFIVVATVVPQLGLATEHVFSVIPFYLIFAICAPLIGWGMSRLFRLESSAGRALAFSAGTRNSLVILPLALAVPGAIPILPAIILTQTLVELLSELIYIRLIARLGVER
ncbi:MAG: arsenic resistance protein [Pelistega sp.]|nr:arsenic resistance protein [Pelistega sp.]